MSLACMQLSVEILIVCNRIVDKILLLDIFFFPSVAKRQGAEFAITGFPKV